MSSKTLGELSISIDYIKGVIDEMRIDSKGVAHNVEAVVIQTTKTNGRVNGIEQREENNIEQMTKLAEAMTKLTASNEGHTSTIKILKWVIGIIVLIAIPLVGYFSSLYTDNVRMQIDLKMQSLPISLCK